MMTCADKHHPWSPLRCAAGDLPVHIALAPPVPFVPQPISISREGALEALAGMLMFGISTAYVFQVLLLYWPDLQAVWQRDRDGAEN
jgi:hypothetical protein